VFFFSWRFLRTHQLYLTTIDVVDKRSKPGPFRPGDPRGFFDKALLGHRSVKPVSFFIRALIFSLVALVMLPLKNNQPSIYWLLVLLIILYDLWCILHGLMLMKRISMARQE